MYISGFVIWGAYAVTSAPEPKMLDKGLIFIKDTDILLSGDRWTIVVNIALEDYATFIDLMKSLLSQVHQKIRVYKSSTAIVFDIHWEELNRLDNLVQELDDDFRNFQKLLFEETVTGNQSTTRIRSKRELFNLLGYGLKYLFGTADARDVKRLAGVCDDLHLFKARMAHATEHQLTYIRTLDERTRQNMVDTAELARALGNSVRNFSLQLNVIQSSLVDAQMAIGRQARYSAAIREIEMSILELKFSMIQIQESLDVTSSGKLSSVLINPYNLSNILQQVSLQLPAGLSMLTGLTVEEMYVYYTVVSVQAVATSQHIRLLIDIPLKSSDRYFELYQVHSLPFFHEGIRKFVMIDETFTYLAVAENRQFFTIITPYMLSKCMQNLYTVCPSDMVLRTAGEQNCLTALFLGKEEIVHKKCRRLMLDESFEPIWIRSPDSSYWIYSFGTPQQVTVQCREMGSPLGQGVNYQTTLKGTGILPNSSFCCIHAENFKLLPHSLGRTTLNLHKTHIMLPNIDNVLHISEESLLQTETQQVNDLRHLDEMVERITSRGYTQGLDVSEVVTALQSREVYSHSSQGAWILGGIAASVGLGILGVIWMKGTNGYCPNVQRKKNESMELDRKLHTCDVELQAQPVEDLGAGDEGPLQTSSQPTVFIQHGRLAVDHP
jgi:hypothetical protein